MLRQTNMQWRVAHGGHGSGPDHFCKRAGVTRWLAWSVQTTTPGRWQGSWMCRWFQKALTCQLQTERG